MPNSPEQLSEDPEITRLRGLGLTLGQLLEDYYLGVEQAEQGRKFLERINSAIAFYEAEGKIAASGLYAPHNIIVDFTEIRKTLEDSIHLRRQSH